MQKAELCLGFTCKKVKSRQTTLDYNKLVRVVERVMHISMKILFTCPQFAAVLFASLNTCGIKWRQHPSQKEIVIKEINFGVTTVLTVSFYFLLHSYDECVGPGSTQIYIPTDDPPPYSLLDPCQSGAEQEDQPSYTSPDPSPYCGETSASAAWFSPSHYPLQGHQHIASISFPMEAAPPYESVLAEQQGQPLPLMPCDLYKHQSERGDEGNSRQPGADQIL